MRNPITGEQVKCDLCNTINNCLRYTRNMSKKPLDDEERQTFIDNLPDEQKNDNAEQIFDEAIERAAQPKRSEPETPDSSDGYSDTQTRSDTTEDTSR